MSGVDMQIPIPPEVQAQLEAVRAALNPARTRIKADTDKGKLNRARWALLNRFVDRQMRTLPVQAGQCWLALFRHADASGRVTRSLAMLERDTGMSKKSIRKGIKALEASGLLRVELKGNNVNGEYATTRYKFEKP